MKRNAAGALTMLAAALLLPALAQASPAVNVDVRVISGPRHHGEPASNVCVVFVPLENSRMLPGLTDTVPLA